MAQMKCEQKQTEDVKGRDIIILKSVHHHGVNVVMPEGISLQQVKPGICHSHREMREVINDERQHNQSAHHHVTRRKRCFDITLVDICLRACTPVFNRQLDSHVDVNDDCSQQEQTN